MTANLEELLNGDTGKTEFEGKLLTRKEILDILVERASITEEEKRRLEEEEAERKGKELRQARYDAEDARRSILENPDIPESAKRALSE